MLPERRKSAEEIAKLRESMGIPGAAPQEPAPQVPPRQEEDLPAAEDEQPSTAPVPAKPVRSLRKSEREVPTPAAAAVKIPPAEKGAAIPARRHNDRELMEMRRAQAAPPDRSIAYIKNPKAPMPKLYPELLDEASVRAVATWVHEELR